MNFLSDFGVQPILLAAQVVNFLILLFILKRFLYKPILKVLETRKQTIADSLKKAEEIEQRYLKMAEEEERKIAKATAEAEKIIKEANDARSSLLDEARAEAQEVARKVMEDGQRQAEAEKNVMRQELREEFTTLIAAGIKVVTGKVLTKKDQKELIDSSVKVLKS